MDRLKSITTYIKKNNLKFLSLLVVLSLCIAMRYAAIGKYASYMQESTQVVAGESFFSSNYLKHVDSIDEVTVSQNSVSDSFVYTIPTWNKYNYVLPIELKNYNNSLKYNKEENQNIFFYVEAKLFSDPECQNPFDPSNSYGMTVTVNYKTSTANAEHGIVGRYKETTTSTPKAISLLQGGNQHTQRVEITVSTYDESHLVTEPQVYIRVMAYMIPLDKLSKITFNADNADLEDLKTETTGVFTTMLGGIFMLGSYGSSSEISCTPIDYPGSYKLLFNTVCTSMDNQSQVNGRLYYNSSKIKCTDPRTDLFSPTTVTGNASEVSKRQTMLENVISDSSLIDTLDTYITVYLESGRYYEISFLKQDLNDFDENYYCFTVEENN